MNQDKDVPQKKTENQITILGIIVHLLILVAVNDLCFKSSTDRGLKPTEPPSDQPPAKRLVLFLADGLTYETVLFEDKSHKSLFLSKIANQGSRGIAYSRFPTTGRAGHLAILTGTQEDPLTVVTKEWTSQSIDADSLIRQSKRTWYWGNTKFLKQFNPDNAVHVHSTKYSLKDEHTDYIKWITQATRNFLAKNKYTINLKSSIFNEKGILFVIHLTLSGSHRNNNGIINLDKSIEAISGFFAQAFTDNSTAFAVTSAYGTTTWGSHGGDSDYEIETPFIAWGAGVKRNNKNVDLNQVDIAPLLSLLIGVSIPVNSLGVVSLDYLNLPKEHFVLEQATNALQLSRVFMKKRSQIRTESLYFRPYKHLNSETITEHFTHLKYLHLTRSYDTLIQDCETFINELLEGIDYYQNYYNIYLLICVIIGYFLWIIYLFNRDYKESAIQTTSLNPLGLLNLIPICFSYAQSWPLMYYIYSAFPFAMFGVAFPYLKRIFNQYPEILTQRKYFNYILLTQIILFSIINRYALSLTILLIGLFPYIPGSYAKLFPNESKIIWSCLCILLSLCSALFSLVPSIFSISFQIYGFTIWIYLCSRWFKKLESETNPARVNVNRSIFIVQNICFIFAGIYKVIEYFAGFQNKYVFLLGSILPILSIPFTVNTIAVRAAAIVFAMLPFYLMSSISAELIFLAIYVVTLLNWLIIETNSSIDLDDGNACSFEEHKEAVEDETNVIRLIFMAAVFLLTGIYGAGNAFSTNSYNPEWMEPLDTCPIILTLLTILKICLPLFICIFVFYAINIETGEYFFKKVCLLIVAFDITIFEMLVLFVFNTSPYLQVRFSQLFAITGYTIIIMVFRKLTNFIARFSLLPYVQKSAILNKFVS